MSNLDKISGEEKEEKKLVTTPEDAKAAFEFWKQFDVPVPDYLQKAMDSFCSNPTVDTQDQLKYAITKAIATTDHECFNDETFSKVRAECSDVSYAMEFDRDFEKVVGEEVTKVENT